MLRSAQIFLFGAEFTAVYAKTTGSRGEADAKAGREKYERVAGAGGIAASTEADAIPGVVAKVGDDPVPMWPAVAGVAAQRGPVRNGLVKVGLALAAGWVFGYALKLPIQAQARRLWERF